MNETRMATGAEMVATFASIADMLDGLTTNLERIGAAGPLNREQVARLTHARFSAAGLARLFRAESALQAALAAGPKGST